MQPAQQPSREQIALAARLRALREEEWPDVELTQARLGEALGGSRPLSIAAISSWESPTSPRVPPRRRLDAYATFFATRRSVEGDAYRVLEDNELTESEQARRDELVEELTGLRDATVAQPSTHAAIAQRVSLSAATTPDYHPARGTWYFADGKPVTIVCGALPTAIRAAMPDPDPSHPDHVEFYSCADLDALIELHGHIRAVNGPDTQVEIRLSSHLSGDDYATHLVLLGGIDWNKLTRELLERRLDLPVRQVSARDRAEAYFEVTDAEVPVRYGPVLLNVGDEATVAEDVAHFYRGPNPFNTKRTVTICNAMYARGTLGAVRTLTDAKFRDRNEAYIASRFGQSNAFSVLSRVQLIESVVVTPDWTLSDVRLHEWSPPAE